MTNPFDGDAARFVVLVNEENQHSLWPLEIEIPRGWSVVHSADTRQGCLSYIEASWIDIKPASLVADAAPYVQHGSVQRNGLWR
jgi:MbtH protein